MTIWSTAQMDPPWMEVGAGKIKRGADRHYPLLKTKDMPGVIQGSGLWTPAENSHLYLWSTNVFLPDAIWLMKELGFVYKTNVVWTKTRVGIGRYFRGKHELLLFGTRGRGWDVRTERNDIASEIETDEDWELYFEGSVVRASHETVNGKRKHSAKPKVFYDMIESRSKGPYVEFFARSKRPGWVSWGNDAAVAPVPILLSTEPPPPPEPEIECLSCGDSGVDIMADGSSRTCHCRAAPPDTIPPADRGCDSGLPESFRLLADGEREAAFADSDCPLDLIIEPMPLSPPIKMPNGQVVRVAERSHGRVTEEQSAEIDLDDLV